MTTSFSFGSLVAGPAPHTMMFFRTGMAIILVCSSFILRAEDSARTFTTPQEAVVALAKAVNETNRAGFSALFGAAAAQDLANPDSVQGAQDLAEFASALNATNRLARQSDTKFVVEVGDNNWPFPIPLVKRQGGWQFDAAAGSEEILNRRIGRNELDVLRILRAAVYAQREYASRDRDGDQVLEFAQKLASSPGQRDGLYWPLDENGEISPLGPLVAYAQREGYSRKSNSDEPQPFHGYLFKILTSQGKHAPGGKYDYIINGNMIGGFAFVAWPAEYGDSGVMTFIVNQQGIIYQQDLGPRTASIVQRMKRYDCDPAWRPSPN